MVFTVYSSNFSWNKFLLADLGRKPSHTSLHFIFFLFCICLTTTFSQVTIVSSTFQALTWPPSSFCSLAVCKNGGERPGIIYHVNDVSVYLGRQRGGGVPRRKNELEAWSCSFCPYARVSNICQVKSVPILVKNKQRVHEMRPFDQWPLPPSVYLGRHWRPSRDKSYQAFPLRICILQAIKNWTVGRPGNEASTATLSQEKWERVWWFSHIELVLIDPGISGDKNWSEVGYCWKSCFNVTSMTSLTSAHLFRPT